MAEINVTPMVDVMLVLLIIFMVTAPLLVAGVPVQLPQSKAGALDQDQKPLEVSIDPSGKIFVDKVETPDVGLGAAFAKARAQGGVKGPQVFLRADKELGYGKVMAVMGELNHAGLNRVALVTTGGSNDAK
jgi:biopolymer transport protein TolR